MTTTTTDEMGYVGKLANIVGTSEPAFRLLLSLIIGYPLAILYRNFIFYNVRSKFLNHLFMILSGGLICFFNYGWDIYHSLIAITGSYIITKLFSGTLLIGATMLFHMSYLLIGYYYTESETYDIKWTMPHCVLVLRLIGLGFDIADGEQDDELLSIENRKSALRKLPTLFEIASYTYFPASVLVGPQFSFKRYDQFMNKDFEKYTQNISAGLKRGGIGFLYLAFNQIGSMFIPDSLMTDPNFDNDYNPLTKILIVGLWGKFTLYKYISCWLISEGVATCFGLTFLKLNADGSEDWSGCENIKLLRFENASKLHHYIDSFNVNTNHWLAQYIFKRLKFLGNRHASHLLALLFLAVWHGFHSGYYVCFFMEFMIIILEKDLEPILLNNQGIVDFLNNPIVRPFIFVFLKLYTTTSIGWSLIPFVYLGYEKWWPIYRSVNLFGGLLFIPWPFIYKPLLKMIIKKTVKPIEKKN